MNIGTASLQRLVELAMPAAFVVSVLLLWIYLRAVKRSMMRATEPVGAASARAARMDATQAPTAAPALALEIVECGAPSALAVRAVWRGPWRAAAVQIAAGIAYALTMAMSWWSLTGFPYRWDAIVVIALIFTWPLVIVVGLVAAVSWRAMAVVALAYGVLVTSAVLAMTAVSDLTASFAAQVWYSTNGLSTVFVLAFLARPIRAMGPLVCALMIAAAAGLFAMNAVMDDPATLRWVAETATGLGFSGYGGGALLGFIVYGVPTLAAGLVCYFVLRGVGRLYRAHHISDQSIQIDSVWLTFAVAHGTGTMAWGGLAAFMAYKLVAWAGYRIMRPAPAGEVTAPRLLLLRVFSLGARSGRLFDGFARLWRHLGSVRMIAGPDLANETVEPYEFLDFLAGRLQRRFITNARVLQQRLAESAAKRDPDGRFRVSSFFCHADTWQMVLRRLARESDVVLMDLRGFTRTNKGCVYELHALLEIVRLEQFVLVVDGTTDEGFLAEVLGQGWANISAISRNRTAPAPRVRIYRLDGSGAVGIDKLVATVASAHAGGLFPEAT